MPRLTHHFTNQDIQLPVLVGPDEDVVTAVINAGGRPPVVLVTAILDTGANRSIITHSVAARLGLHTSGHGSTQTTGGHTPVVFYHISIGFPPILGVSATTVLTKKIEVGSVATLEPGIDVLFGLDLLLLCRLFIDGPAQTFTLDF
jgi:Aspartyl protease